MSITTAVILAGGQGTRLRGAVPNLPKPMAPINDHPFIEYQMDYWIGQGIKHFILSVGYLKNIIIDYFGDKYKDATIEYAIEHEPLGTGGGLLLATKNLTKPFLLLNGDTFFEVNLKQLHDFHLKHDSKWTFSLFKTMQLNRYMGMDVDSNGEILSLKSRSKKKDRLANGGAYIISPKILVNYGQDPIKMVSLEDDLLPKIMKSQERLYGMECQGKFIDIGVPSDYYRATEILSK